MAVDVNKSSTTARSGSPVFEYVVPKVNLLPPEIAAERAFRRTQFGLVAVTVAVAAVVGGGYALSAASTASARDALAVEQARTTQLQAEQVQYAEVPLVLSQVEQAQTARASAMATDVKWFDYLRHLAATYPTNVWLKDLDVASGTTAAVATTPGAATAAPGLGAVPVYTLTFNGTGRSVDDVAAFLDVLAEVPGFADPTYSTATRTEVDGTVVVDFTSTVSVTADALSHRFEQKAS